MNNDNTIIFFRASGLQGFRASGLQGGTLLLMH